MNETRKNNVTRTFSDQLAPIGHTVTLEGVRYRLLAVTPLSDGVIKHELRPLD